MIGELLVLILQLFGSSLEAPSIVRKLKIYLDYQYGPLRSWKMDPGMNKWGSRAAWCMELIYFCLHV